MDHVIYKIVPATLWKEWQGRESFTGAPIDIADGFIHLSTADQVAETGKLHFAGQSDLLLVAVDGDALGETLVYEPSRAGALFPHLYDTLPKSAVLWEKPLPRDADGALIFPELGR